MNWTGQTVSAAVGGTLIRGAPSQSFHRVVTDSRIAQPGDLFVALSGPRFDGHQFLSSVAACPVAGAVVQCGRYAGVDGIPWMVEVADTVRAFGNLAQYQRRSLTVPVIAITGSSGKTTTKEMLTHILGERRAVVASVGTQNNHIGVPLTLLRVQPSDEVVIVETGTNHFGELAALGHIAGPTIAVVTNIGPAHLASFGSLDGVAKAKWELVEAMGPAGIAVLNHDDPYLRTAAQGWPGRIVWFGTDPSGGRNGRPQDGSPGSAGFWIEQVSEESWGIRATINRRHPLRLPLPGRHNLLNAAAAIACAQLVGFDMAMATQALGSYIPLRGRLERQIIGGVRFINDAYNANPASARTAIEALLQWAGPSRRFVVLGDMRELGVDETRHHAELGTWLGQLPIDGLLTLGSLARHSLTAARTSGLHHGWHCRSVEEISGRLEALLQPGDVVLVKGSRAMQMERVLQCFMNSSTH